MQNKTKILKAQQIALWDYPKNKDKVKRLREEQKLLRNGLLINNPKAIMRREKERKKKDFKLNIENFY